MSTARVRYAELHAVSNFSFLRGASHPEELISCAAARGYDALAITDECSLAGVVRAHTAAQENTIKLILGSEFWLDQGVRVVLLARTIKSYSQISNLITRARRRALKGEYTLTLADFESTDDCIALIALDLRACVDASKRQEMLEQLAAYFPQRCWLAVELLFDFDDAYRLGALTKIAEQVGFKLVAAGDVHMHERSRRALQDTLTAIRLNTPLHEAHAALQPSGERHLRTLSQLAQIYPHALLEESVRIAEQCCFSLAELRYEYPKEITPPGVTPCHYLRQLTEEGMQERWPDGAPEKIKRQVEHELALITELSYEPYFLTVYDIVAFARSRDILCQGRGSAANSVVCYCLRITEVDPVRMSMLFERFISKERNEPPDIDVDFEHERREEVMQYIFDKYGRDRAALTATVITYRPRSAIRDVGKALGLELSQIDRLAKSLAWWDGQQVLSERFVELGLDPNGALLTHLSSQVEQIIGFPRHLSQHTGGFVISDKALSNLVPIENAAMPERTVIQWDKDDLDTLGLLKVDVLALGMLTAIRKAFDVINQYYGKNLSLAAVPAEDADVYDMICDADTMGVFQIESRAQMAMLPRMRPRTFYDLVIEVAIVRPGPIQGGMVHPYLRRRQGLESVTYPSEAVRDVLKRTLGVPIFQEQAMQLAIVAAGFTPGEADSLRRAMAAWRRRGGLGAFERRLIDGMRERGYSETFAKQVFKQIEGFGEYGFPESHSASFALLVYVSAWLKCHEPAAFACALINSQPMGFYACAQLVQDAKKHGVEVLPVDVNYSEWDCCLETRRHQTALRLGFRIAKGLSKESVQHIVEARAQGLYVCVSSFAHRTGLARAVLKRLASAGTLASLTSDRHTAHWSALGVQPSLPLLEHLSDNEGVPMLRRPSEGEDLVADYRALGLSLGRHPLSMLRARFSQSSVKTAGEVAECAHREQASAVGLVINRQRPSTASGVIFMTLEDETGHINVVVWPTIANIQRRVVLGARLVTVHGFIEREGSVVHLVAKRFEDYSPLLGRLQTRSRDFH